MKLRSFISMPAIAITLIMVACTNKSVETESTKADSVVAFDLEKAKATIRELDDKFSADVKRGDSLALAGHYSADALAMPPNSEPVGKDGLSTFWGGVIRMGVKDLKLEITEISGNDQQLAETGKYEMYRENNKLLDKGKYVVVWKQENGAWKIYRDIFNTSMPPPATK